MKYFLSLYFLFTWHVHCKEWQSFSYFQKQTGKHELSSSDWLTKDRKQNTLVWQQANTYNLINSLFDEYQSIQERRDFYLWYYKAIENKGHQVIWPKMAHYISKKLRLTMAFPFKIFIRKSVKKYSEEGSSTVFNKAFLDMRALFLSKEILANDLALEWDKEILKKEQYDWLIPVYKTVDTKTKKTITNIAKGTCFYAFLVPQPVRFKGDLSNAKERYDYALIDLRNYCKSHYK